MLAGTPTSAVDAHIIDDHIERVFVQQAHFYKPGRHANNELWCMFQQQHRAEGTLLSNISNNELLIINLATVPVDRNSIFRPS